MLKRWLIVMVLMATTQVGDAIAADLHLPISGTLEIDAQGHVTDCEVTSKAASEGVKAVVMQNMRRWTFEPVIRNGVAVPARTKVALRLLAQKVGNDYQLKIESAQFYGARESTKGGMTPPRYPPEAARIGLGGSVLLALQVDAQGKVLDVVPVQSSLLAGKARERILEQWRGVFEKASLQAARQWTFQPADAAKGDELVTTLIVPVDFRMGDGSKAPLPLDQEGWRSDRAGPVREIPWLAADHQQFNADGLQGGQAMAIGEPPVRPITELVGTLL